jgi:hypothetical protein
VASNTLPSEIPDLKIDLVETLIANEVFGPESMKVDHILNWFATEEMETAEELIETMHENADCPLKYRIGKHSEVWLRDKDEALEYIEELRQSSWH